MQNILRLQYGKATKTKASHLTRDATRNHLQYHYTLQLAKTWRESPRTQIHTRRDNADCVGRHTVQYLQALTTQPQKHNTDNNYSKIGHMLAVFSSALHDNWDVSSITILIHVQLGMHQTFGQCQLAIAANMRHLVCCRNIYSIKHCIVV